MKHFNLFGKLKTSKKYIVIFIFIDIVLTAAIFLFVFLTNDRTPLVSTLNPQPSKIHLQPSIIYRLPSVPSQKVLSNGGYHIFQTFNNCGPAALSMALRFYGTNVSQAQLGQALRPYQIPGGDNDDKSVTLDELGEKAKEYGLIPYHRPMGNPQIVKQFIANDMPVIARTLTKPTEDIGHYRVIKG